MLVLPPGVFDMGSPQDEKGRDSDEGPQHRVTIPRPFALSRCEISVGQFRRFVEETGYQTWAEQPDSGGCYAWNAGQRQAEQDKGKTWRNPGFPQTEAHPVVCVAWQDAQAYANWLSARTGAVYRLPSEAEWEYAARARTQTARYWEGGWGPRQQCAYANGAGQEAKAIAGKDWTLADCSDAYVYTAPIASFAPNQFGLYDMLGNVWEWTADCWHGNYDKPPRDGSAWLEAEGGDCNRRGVRGGAWSYYPQNLRSANRGGDIDAYIIVGFRLARAL
jgi:formylglycine-generating enzyme required for sulfatase activity